MCTVRIAIGHAMVRGVNTRYTEESQEEEEGCVEKENLCVSTHQRAVLCCQCVMERGEDPPEHTHPH